MKTQNQKLKKLKQLYINKINVCISNILIATKFREISKFLSKYIKLKRI